MGRPALLATTKHFLEDLGLQSLDQLPELTDVQLEDALSGQDAALQAAGLSAEEAALWAPGLDLQVVEEGATQEEAPSDASTTIPHVTEAGDDADTPAQVVEAPAPVNPVDPEALEDDSSATPEPEVPDSDPHKPE